MNGEPDPRYGDGPGDHGPDAWQHSGELDLSTPESVELTSVEIRAVQLRMAGLAYHEIARQLGYKSKGSAYKAVERALDKWGWPSVDAYRRLELSRLDAITSRLWPQVLGHPGRPAGVDEHGSPVEEQAPVPPDKEAIRLYMRISERRAKLLGLDAPEQVQIQPSTQARPGEAAVTSYEQWISSVEEIVDAEVISDETVADENSDVDDNG